MIRMLFCLATVAVLGGLGKAKADSAQILTSCEILLRELKLNGERVVFPEGGYPCWFYLLALQDVSVISPDGGKTRWLGACAPPETKLTTLIRVFTRYAEQNPAELNHPPVFIAMNAWQRAFPCPEQPPGR